MPDIELFHNVVVTAKSWQLHSSAQAFEDEITMTSVFYRTFSYFVCQHPRCEILHIVDKAKPKVINVSSKSQREGASRDTKLHDIHVELHSRFVYELASVQHQ